MDSLFLERLFRMIARLVGVAVGIAAFLFLVAFAIDGTVVTFLYERFR